MTKKNAVALAQDLTAIVAQYAQFLNEHDLEDQFDEWRAEKEAEEA